MTEQIKKYIDENINIQPMYLIYDNLKQKFNEHDIKFILLMCYNCDIEKEIMIEYEEKEKRQYQKMLRLKAFEKYDNKCVISGIEKGILLEVAHIKPVSECKNIQEKSDVNNTLLLWIDIHKYFDNYQITINPNTSKIECKCDYLMKYNGIKLDLDKETKKYLEHHYSKYNDNL